jgi:hypothetical protein
MARTSKISVNPEIPPLIKKGETGTGFARNAKKTK